MSHRNNQLMQINYWRNACLNDCVRQPLKEYVRSRQMLAICCTKNAFTESFQLVVVNPPDKFNSGVILPYGTMRTNWVWRITFGNIATLNMSCRCCTPLQDSGGGGGKRERGKRGRSTSNCPMDWLGKCEVGSNRLYNGNPPPTQIHHLYIT